MALLLQKPRWSSWNTNFKTIYIPLTACHEELGGVVETPHPQVSDKENTGRLFLRGEGRRRQRQRERLETVWRGGYYRRRWSPQPGGGSTFLHVIFTVSSSGVFSALSANVSS